MEEKAKKGSKKWVIAVLGVVIVGALFVINGPTTAVGRYKKTEAVVMANSIAVAVEYFYGEYDRLPDVGGSWVQTEEDPGMKLLEILHGMEAEGPQMQNSRQIIFHQGKEAKGGKGGIVYDDANKVIAIYDPFGRPYTVILNVDKSDTLIFNWGGKTVRLRGKQVAVWSVGADGVEGTKDDAKSWN